GVPALDRVEHHAAAAREGRATAVLAALCRTTRRQAPLRGQEKQLRGTDERLVEGEDAGRVRGGQGGEDALGAVRPRPVQAKLTGGREQAAVGVNHGRGGAGGPGGVGDGDRVAVAVLVVRRRGGRVSGASLGHVRGDL